MGDIKHAITVGVIGYPNVGKSSIINSLKRSKVSSTSSTPGHTKTVQHVQLDKHITLLDSPGVLFSGADDDASLALRNSLRIEQLESPVDVAETIVNRCPVQQLMQIYQIPIFQTPEEFLYHIATKRGYLKKGGIPHIETSARTVLRDWNSGKISYYCCVPDHLIKDTSDPYSEGGNSEDTESGPQIVNSWGKEFDFDALLNSNMTEI